jgi:predicted nucleic acid-binding protein
MDVSLLDAIAEGATVTVDAAPIIYVLDGHPTLAEPFMELFAAIEAGRNQAVISAITIAEVLSGPLKLGREALAERYKQVLTASPGWSVMDVDSEVAESAARLRARYGLRLPDAIQLATAIRSGSSALVTHDRDFSKVREIPIVMA